METKTFIALKNPINTGGGSTLMELRINVDYQKGGYNYFNGKYSEGGVYVYLTPVTRAGMFTQQVIDGTTHNSGYKIMLKPLNRKSQKQIDLVAEKVLPYAQQIADLYSDGRHQDIYNLVKSIV